MRTTRLARSVPPGDGRLVGGKRQNQKVCGPVEGILFLPIGVRDLGGPGPLTANLISQVGEAVEQATGEKRAGAFLSQRLLLNVQRGNAISVMGTMQDWRPFLRGVLTK